MLIDTHCHIHEDDYPISIEDVFAHVKEAGIEKMICIGTSNQSTEQAVAFAEAHEDVWASIGVHPHESKDGWQAVADTAGTSDRIVAVGEIGLDYFYSHSPKEVQVEALKAQLHIAQQHDLPVIFHVREAFDDFWPIFDAFPGIRGELHSFTDTHENLQEALRRGLSIGVNGISTFTKDEAQQAMFDAIPLDRLLFETDAPFLTPKPFRGKVNEPAFVRNIAQYHADRRGITLQEIADASSANATRLFAL
jgi:TatD DNase family protein